MELQDCNITDSYANQMELELNEDNAWLRHVMNGMAQRPKPALKPRPKQKLDMVSNKQRRGIKYG